MLLSACGNDMECVRGHEEVKVRPAYTEKYTEYVNVGGIDIPYPREINHPERSYTLFICDEYQKKS